MPLGPADPSIWQGRDDRAEGPLALRWHQRVQCRDPASLPRAAGADAVALLGFASDTGVRRNGGRGGAWEGPSALRAMLAGLPCHPVERELIDVGDVRVEADALESAQEEFGTLVATLLGAGYRPIGLGGGHEIGFASWLGLADHLADRASVAPRIGIVNLDAHLDLRQAAQRHSGTPFLDIARDCERRGWPFHYACLGASPAANTGALYAEAERRGVWIEPDLAITPERLPALLARLDRWLAGMDAIYLTICLDVFPADTAPGVSAPAALGIDPRVAIALIAHLRASGLLRLADLAELSPPHDIDRRTARLAARLVWELARG